MATITTSKNPTMRLLLSKKLLMVSLAATALTLSACNREEEAPMESSVHEFDFQTSEEEAAAEIASTDPMNESIESAILPSSDQPEGTGDVSGMEAGAVDGEVATAGFGMKEGMYTDDDTAGANTSNSNVANTGENTAVENSDAMNNNQSQATQTSTTTN